MSVVDLTEDDDNNNNNDIDVDRTPSSQSALIHTIDDDDDNDDDAVVEIAPPTHKRKRINEPAPRTNRVPSGENSMSTALPVIHENIRRLEAAIGRMHPRFFTVFRDAEREALRMRRQMLIIELPPPPRVLSSHWYAFLCLLDVVAVVDAEFVPLLALNALARCFVLEPRSGNTRTIDTATIFNAPQFLAAIRAAGASVQLRKRAFGASVGESTAALLAAANAAAAAEVADTRDLRSAQEVAYAESLAVDQQRVQLRERLQRRRAAAIAHRDERLKRVIAVPVPCAVRVRLPNGALIESVFDRDADQVAALLDFVVIEASLQLGDTFDIANYQLFSLYPKRYIAGELADGSSDPSAALTLVDAVSAAAGADRRVLLILEER